MGSHWDLTGTHFVFYHVFEFCHIYDFFCYYYVMKNLVYLCLSHAGTGLVRPPGSSHLHRRGVVLSGGAEARGLDDMAQNLEGLTARIPRMTFDEVPYRLQRHTMGVLWRLRSLLCRAVRDVACCHDHHPLQEISDYMSDARLFDLGFLDHTAHFLIKDFRITCP